MNAPIMKKVASGWMAISSIPGDRWTVIGQTEEDALRRYYDRLEEHKEVDSRPFNFEREVRGE